MTFKEDFILKFTYGNWDFSSLKKAEENSYLLSNGLGGVSSLTMAGSMTRSDHALLSLSLCPPVNRIALVRSLREQLFKGETCYRLNTQTYVDNAPETGFKHIGSFAFDALPEWVFHTSGVETEKRISFEYGENTLAISYHITNDTKEPVRLSVCPLLAFTPKGSADAITVSLNAEKNCLSGGDLKLYFSTNGTLHKTPDAFTPLLAFDYDKRDGRNSQGRAFTNHTITFEAEPFSEKDFFICYTLKKHHIYDANMFEREIQRKTQIAQKALLASPAAKCLVKNGDAFLSLRSSTGEKTILAGYPFFYDWGRDTMIAVMGLCTATNRFEDTKSILKSFTAYLKDGLLPNMFPECGAAPLYNTVDASLLWILALYDYFVATKDKDFLRDMYPFGREIIAWYEKGTRFGIGMDSDGLIRAGEGLYQLTWMDVRIDDYLPTKRHGKPVEINAWWHSALCAMAVFSKALERSPAPYEKMAQKAKNAFNEKFWNDRENCLKDVLSGASCDVQVRSNQIWAVSAPFPLLDREKEKCVVRKVFETLYTPCGLRTLSPLDAEYQGQYTGDQRHRDMAYHQGTVWPFPLGAYFRAFLKVHDYAPCAIARVRRELTGLESALREGGIGFLSEVYDGTQPNRSKGCYAQAWSTGEILRVYKELEKHS